MFTKAQSIKRNCICGVDYSDEPLPRSGRQWVRAFVKAHPTLKVAKGRILELARQRAWNREVIEPFFKKFGFFLFICFDQTLGYR